MSMSKIVGIVFLVLVFFLGLTWIAEGNNFFLYKFFAPKMEQVRRETFEQTKSYRQGMIQELQNMQFEYEKADAEHKAALASIILHRAADFPEEDMPSDLWAFLQKLRHEKAMGATPTSSAWK